MNLSKHCDRWHVLLPVFADDLILYCSSAKAAAWYECWDVGQELACRALAHVHPCPVADVAHSSVCATMS